MTHRSFNELGLQEKGEKGDFMTMERVYVVSSLVEDLKFLRWILSESKYKRQ